MEIEHFAAKASRCPKYKLVNIVMFSEYDYSGLVQKTAKKMIGTELNSTDSSTFAYK